jgi:hypothetical protein
MPLPYCTHAAPYTDTATALKTVGDLRRLIAGVPDDTRVYLFGVAGYDTVDDCEAEWKTQQCVEHRGLVHDVTGLIIQCDG